jgi:hypothetical protein
LDYKMTVANDSVGINWRNFPMTAFCQRQQRVRASGSYSYVPSLCRQVGKSNNLI